MIEAPTITPEPTARTKRADPAEQRPFLTGLRDKLPSPTLIRSLSFALAFGLAQVFVPSADADTALVQQNSLTVVTGNGSSSVNNSGLTENGIRPALPKPDCAEVTRRSYDNHSELTCLIEESRRPVNYAEIVTPTTQVLAFGETHTNEEAKREVITNMKEFKALGFTHFGLEMVSSDMQELLDQYYTDSKPAALIRQHLQERFGPYSRNATDLYMGLFYEAKLNGIRLIALDLPQDKSKRKSILETLNEIPLRDQHMAGIISNKIAESPDNKIITYTGAAHNTLTSEMIQLIQGNGIEIKTVGLTGDKTDSGLGFTVASRSAGLSRERFMTGVRVIDPTAISPVDWFIHLPQPG